MHKQNIDYIGFTKIEFSQEWLRYGLLLTTEETSIEWVFLEAGGIIARKNRPKYPTPCMKDS